MEDLNGGGDEDDGTPLEGAQGSPNSRLKIKQDKMTLLRRALSQMVKYKVILLKIFNHFISLEQLVS